MTQLDVVTTEVRTLVHQTTQPNTPAAIQGRGANPPVQPIHPYIAFGRGLPPPGFPPVDPLPQGHLPLRPMKLDFPRFSGTNPTGWLFRAERYFEYHFATNYQRLQIASFHIEDVALKWFQ